MLRPLQLPESLGLPSDTQVFLSEMPGRRQESIKDMARIDATGIGHVLCLLSQSEVGTSQYFDLIADGYLEAEFHHCPLNSACRAEQQPELTEALGPLIENLRNGESLLIHCQYGEVRTGCAAAALLILLGLGFEEALAAVRAAGSDPEAFEEAPLLRAFARRNATITRPALSG
jgi:predicted protein tyrosine phosphatase